MSRSNLALFSTVIYCALSWVVIRVEYFAGETEIPVGRQSFHLLFTALVLLILALRNLRQISQTVRRLFGPPVRRQAAFWMVAIFLLFCMTKYPRNRNSLFMFLDGLIGSTETVVEGLFLAGAALGAAGALFLNVGWIKRSLIPFFEGLLFRSRRTVFLLAVMALVFFETNAISFFYFQHMPVSVDGADYIFQAKIFADGNLYVDPPKYPEFFYFFNMIVSDKWYSVYPPGFPLILALGIISGVPWIVNPILAALCVLFTFLIAQRLYDDRIARGSAALMTISPFFLMLSSTYLSHTATAFFLVLSLYFYLKGLDDSQWFHFLAAGLAVGAMATIRPLTGFAASLPLCGLTLWLIFRGKVRIASAMVFAFGVAVPAGFLLWYNSVTNGHPLTFGYAALYGEAYRIGFVKPPRTSFYSGRPYTPLQAMINLNSGLHYLSVFLLGWPIPSLAFAMAPFALPSRNWRDYFLLALVLAIPVCYFFYFCQSFLMGPRFYFSVIPPMVILIARGVELAPLLWSRLAGRDDIETKVSRYLAVLICVCALFCAAYFFPQQLKEYERSSPNVRQSIEEGNIDNAIVFINYFSACMGYGEGFWRNDPSLEGNIIYAHDRGNANTLLMKEYPGRRYYRYFPAQGKFEEIFINHELPKYTVP